MGRVKGSKNKPKVIETVKVIDGIEVTGCKKVKPEPVKVEPKKKDDVKPLAVKPKDEQKHVKVIVTWRDQRNRERQTCYVMADDLSIQENTSEEFVGAKKKTRISLTIDGSVLEKS